MSRRVTLKLTLELLSDAIFGSGYSIPGGEDIAVYRDGAGYPYLRGSTCKGLLRESLANLLAWTGGDESTLDAMMGEEGWNGITDERRIQLTDLTLCDKPADPESCFSMRTFTELKDGTVKEGSLRTAACVRRGLCFAGQLCCAAEDAELIRQALAGIQWAGTMRSRGFGHIRVTAAEMPEEQNARSAVRQAVCLYYRLRTENPVVITDHGRSDGNSLDTYGFISGPAVRGMVLSELARRDPTWFEAHKVGLLTDKTRFLDAMPSAEGYTPIPSILGFYEDKAAEHFESVVVKGDFTPGFKRAKIGSFCALDGDTLIYWNAATGGSTRIRRPEHQDSDTKMFQTRYLEPGQLFEGYILLDEPDLAEAIAHVLNGTVWLGADRYGGFGCCTVVECRAVDRPAWLDVYEEDKPCEELYMLALSPLAMLNEEGDVCGIDAVQLAGALGVSDVKVLRCSTSVSEYGGYNRAWASRVPAARMYDRGSLFLLKCDAAPTVEALRRLERQGLGIRRAEGFGQVLFLHGGLLRDIARKKAARETEAKGAVQSKARKQRLEHIEWIEGKASDIQKLLQKESISKLSSSQLGGIQAQCERAIAQGGDTEALYCYLKHNLKKRGAKQEAKFEEIDQLLRDELDGAKTAEQRKEKLQWFCDLFDYVRKLPMAMEKEVQG